MVAETAFSSFNANLYHHLLAIIKPNAYPLTLVCTVLLTHGCLCFPHFVLFKVWAVLQRISSLES